MLVSTDPGLTNLKWKHLQVGLEVYNLWGNGQESPQKNMEKDHWCKKGF